MAKTVSEVNWKERALERRLVIKYKDKRIKELTFGRNSWKEKHAQQKEKALKAEKELKMFKKKLIKILNN